MGCAVSQRGVVDDEGGSGTIMDVFEQGGSGIGDFTATKVGMAGASTVLSTYYFSMAGDPPVLPSGMGYGDAVDTMDGAPEEYGGGGDYYVQFTMASGIKLAVTPFTWLPRKDAGSIEDELAISITADDYLIGIDHGNNDLVSWDQIVSVGTITPSIGDGKIWHPIFDTPSQSEYYSAAIQSDPMPTNGVLVAVCLGAF
jgi:hypothetical protein